MSTKNTIVILGWAFWTCLGCSSAPLDPLPSDLVSVHYAKDGTRFKTVQDSVEALPHHFPEYLILPESTILSSGQIEDRAGGVASLLLRTSLSKIELMDHYREGMWFRYWDLLTELTPEDSHILTFEYVHPESTRYQQAVIQISTPSAHSQTHEILILYSYDTPIENWANYPDKQTLDQLPGSSTVAQTRKDIDLNSLSSPE